MTKHIEYIVRREAVRDADRVPAERATDGKPSGTGSVGPLIPVREIAGLTPDEQIAELRLRVQSGVYGRPSVVEQVARAMLPE